MNCMKCLAEVLEREGCTVVLATPLQQPPTQLGLKAPEIFLEVSPLVYQLRECITAYVAIL